MSFRKDIQEDQTKKATLKKAKHLFWKYSHRLLPTGWHNVQALIVVKAWNLKCLDQTIFSSSWEDQIVVKIWKILDKISRSQCKKKQRFLYETVPVINGWTNFGWEKEENEMMPDQAEQLGKSDHPERSSSVEQLEAWDAVFLKSMSFNSSAHLVECEQCSLE